ncbi:MAG: M24 family metallopeptidase [Acidiferrobacterales bacterium]
MSDIFQRRALELQRRMADANIDVTLLTDPDSIYYVSGYWGYLGVEFGRPTMVVVPRSGDCTVITPLMESEMASNMTWIQDIRKWVDGVDGEWMRPLRHLLGQRRNANIGIEQLRIPALVSEFVRAELPKANYVDASSLLSEMRMIKDPEEIGIMRQAGQVAVSMTAAAEQTIGEGVPEYEVALAVIAAGTRKAAEFLTPEERDRFVSPTIYNLQILQSGHDTCFVHRRSTARRLRRGDPVYLCYCGIANFKQYKLGFDREYFVAEVTDEQARIYEAAVAAQAAALQSVRPGVVAEEVHAAADAAYREAGYEPAYRTGRGIGCSFLEKPEFKPGDETPLAAGMTFAVDGGITIPGRFGARVGDSILVTDTGFEYLTPYPRELHVL